MALTGTNISDRITEVMQDGAVTWTTTHLLAWINEAQRAICDVRPDAYTLTGASQLTAATTIQTVPTGTVRLKEVTRNMGSNGTTPGRAITLISRQELDEFNPDWHTAAASTTIKHWVYSEDNPSVYWVFPRVHATTAVWVELVRFAVPTQLSSLSNNIYLGDQYSPAIIEWVLYRCFGRNSESISLIQKSGMHLQSFFMLLGAQKQAESMVRAKIKEGSL